MGLREDVQVSVLAEVGRQADDLGPRLGEGGERVAERRRLRALVRVRRAKRSSPRSSAAACRPSLAAFPLFREPDRTDVFRAPHDCLPASSSPERLLPFVRFDAQEVVALALLQKRHALRHLGVADDDAGLRLRRCCAPRRRPATRARCRCRRRAGRASRTPRTSASSGSKFRTFVDGPSACWLLTSTMPIRLSSSMAAGRHCRLPGRALVELAVGEEVVDERGRVLALEREADADGDREAVTERTAGDLHSGRVGRHAGHGQAAVVRAVGLELVLRAGFRPRSAPRRERWRNGRSTAGIDRAPPTRDRRGR